jgi:cytochrome oxidase assembly protein ShyY1
MVRTAWWVLRQRRYARLAVLMVFIAAGCVAAGTWQISRYEQTARINRTLTANAHAAAVPLSTLRVPLVGAGPAPSRDAIRYRTVTVSGTYVAGTQEFVPDQSVGGRAGFSVVNPLQTADGVLMVVRGFVAGDAESTRPPAVPLPPTRVQQVVGRLQTPATTSDDAQELSQDEISTVNPTEQARRLGTPVVNAYLNLSGRQSSNAGLTVLPAPDLSNPAGGAVEPQHLAYIVQWYLFALLALAAPFAVARSEVRDARRTYLGIDPDGGDFGAELADPEPAHAQLGTAPARAGLPGGRPSGDGPPAEAIPADGVVVDGVVVDGVAAGGISADAMPADGAVAVRERAEVARREAVQAQRLARAERLASRYGRSLTTGHAWAPEPLLGPDAEVDVRAGRVGRASDYAVANSADSPHRSPDAYHGLYNDYLWQLAMADGDLPHVAVPADDAPRPPTSGGSPTPRPTPTIIAPDGTIVATPTGPTEPTPPGEPDEDPSGPIEPPGSR